MIVDMFFGLFMIKGGKSSVFGHVSSMCFFVGMAGIS